MKDGSEEAFSELTVGAHQKNECASLIAEALNYFIAYHQNFDEDLDRINDFAEGLNQKAEETLDYQNHRLESGHENCPEY